MNARADNVPQPEIKIIISEVPYTYYPQIKLDENFEVYFNSTLRAQESLRAGIRMTPYQQPFEFNTGTQSINENFVSANRLFAVLDVSLVCDKNDQHKTIYDSYNVEIEATKNQSLNIEKAWKTYTLTREIKHDFDDADDDYWLYSQFVAFSFNACSVAHLVDYASNEVYQELVEKGKHLTSSDKRLYIDLKRSKGYTDILEEVIRDVSDLSLAVTLKDPATKKMKLRVLGYS